MYIRGLIIAPRPPRAQTTALKKKKKKKKKLSAPQQTALQTAKPHSITSPIPCNHPKESSPPPTHPPKTWSERRSDKSVDTGRPQRGHKHSRRTIIEIGIAGGPGESWRGEGEEGHGMYKKRNNVAREGIHERKVDPISVDSRVLGNYLSSRFNRRPVFRIGSNDAVYRIYIVVRPSNCLNYPSISLSRFPLFIVFPFAGRFSRPVISFLSSALLHP